MYNKWFYESLDPIVKDAWSLINRLLMKMCIYAYALHNIIVR